VDDDSQTVTGTLLQEAPDAPRPLSETGLANVVAFAKLACIQPNIPAGRTPAGIAAGVDEILQKGIAVVKGGN